ncbi:MAG: trypsin-like peptidase domain-containing protein [Candidatus Dependentiae bacterium]|nr:trypsin-like peptidase domain-containing protein [Candidatus Dependentiae bacterium]
MVKKKNLFLIVLFLGISRTPRVSLAQPAWSSSDYAMDANPAIHSFAAAIQEASTPPDPGAIQTAPARPSRSLSSTANPWAWVHDLIARNAVAQVFTYHAEFNWIEPYKTPRQGMGAGSAFFISKDGTLVTNYHVIEGERGAYIQLPFFGKRRFDVKVIGACPERDLALIRVIPEDLTAIMNELGSLPILELGDSDEVKRADEVMTLGYPLGQEWLKSTIGVVSGQQHVGNRYMIQIDAAINPGNSGGPSFDRDGKVIGVNTSGIIGEGIQNVGYIIPVNEVKLFLQQLEGAPIARDVKFLRKPFLGGVFIDASENMARFFGNPINCGCYTVAVCKNSPIDKAGVKAGDMIYEIDGHPVDYFGDLQVSWSEDRVSITDYTSRLKVGDSIHLVYYREGKKYEADVTFSLAEVLPVRVRYPDFEFIDYEVIGGVVVMELTLNHILLLAKENPRLGNYMEFDKQLKPALLITHLLPDSEAAKSRVLAVGDVIGELNGVRVKTLEEFRNAVLESKKSGYITLKVERDIFAVLSLQRALVDEKKLSEAFFYRITPFVAHLIADQTKVGA